MNHILKWSDKDLKTAIMKMLQQIITSSLDKNKK